MKIGDKVKIIQENAPYNSSGKLGVILDIDYDKLTERNWFWVRFDKPNDNLPYESWFVKEHLKVENNE